MNEAISLEEVVRLLVSALIEARSCERFGVLMAICRDDELQAFYKALYSSELGHYKVFLKLAARVAGTAEFEGRWREMLEHERDIIARQPPGMLAVIRKRRFLDVGR